MTLADEIRAEEHALTMRFHASTAGRRPMSLDEALALGRRVALPSSPEPRSSNPASDTAEGPSTGSVDGNGVPVRAQATDAGLGASGA